MDSIAKLFCTLTHRPDATVLNRLIFCLIKDPVNTLLWSYLMKKEVVVEVGWLEDNVTAGPNWTGLLCLDVLMETEVAAVSESGAG